MDERIEQCARQIGGGELPREASTGKFPKRGLRKVLAPEDTPPSDGAPVSTKQLGQLADTPG